MRNISVWENISAKIACKDYIDLIHPLADAHSDGNHSSGFFFIKNSAHKRKWDGPMKIHHEGPVLAT